MKYEETPVDEMDMGADLERVLLSRTEIQEGIDRLAAEVDAKYAGKDLLLIL